MEQLREGYHVVDVLGLYAPVTKAAMQLRRPADARQTVSRALWVATSGRPGPVLLDLPKDVSKSPLPDDAAPAGPASDRAPAIRVAPSSGDVHAVAETLAVARRPVLLAGGGIHWSGAHAALAALARTHGLPVLVTDGGRGAVDEDDPHFLGVVARQAGDLVARTRLAEADVVVAVGTPFSDVSTFEWSAWSRDTHVVQVDVEPEVLHRGAPATRAVVADAREFLEALDHALVAIGAETRPPWSDERAELEQERTSHRELAGIEHARLVNPWVLVDELAERMPADAFVSVDSGMHSFYGKKLAVHRPRTYIRSSGFGAMGFAMTALLGALEAAPDRRAVAIAGDGCMAMCLGEFETAARRGSRLTVVIFDDARFSSQQSHQYRRFDGRVVGTSFNATDFVAVAEAQGVPGWQVEDDASARDAIRAALALDGPSVIDARLDREVQPTTWIEGSGDRRLAGTTARG